MQRPQRMQADGSGSAAAVFVGTLVGSGAQSRLREYVRTLQVLFLLIGAFTLILLFAA